MPKNWKTYKLGEISTLGDGAHSKVKRIDHGILYLTSKNFKDGRLKLDKIDYIAEKDFNRLFSSNSKAVNKPSIGDVLIGIIGTLGNAYLYKENDVFGISSSVAIIRPDNTKLLSKFLYYCITDNKFKHYQNAHNGASVQGYTNLPSLRSIPIKLPELPEQQSIASILSVIDDKIENNLAINKTLEEMAIALYKHWFVDFGPFKDGEFVESEIFGINNLISIPKDFKILYIKEEITRLKSTSKYIQDNVLKVGKTRVFDQSSNRILGYHNNQPDFKADFENPLLIFGDHTCRMELICENFSVGPNLIPFKTDTKEYTYLVYLTLKDKVRMNDYKRHWSELMLHQFIVPNDISIINDFNNSVKEFFNLINKNEIENQTLTQLRDTLLPKLISGEVRLIEFRE